MIKEDRSIWLYILLSIITCGFYSYYFIYTIARDTNTMCNSDNKNTGGLLKFIVLSFITCGIYTWYWYYTLGNRLAENAPRYGLHFEENGTTVLLWLLFGSLLCGIGFYVSMNIIIQNVNAMAREYNKGNSDRPEQDDYVNENIFYVEESMPSVEEQRVYRPEEGLQEPLKQSGKITCPSCSRENNEHAVFCRYCGSAVGAEVKEAKSEQINCCPNCGQAADEGEIFCVLCGTQIVTEAVSGVVTSDIWEGRDEDATVMIRERSDEDATVMVMEGNNEAVPSVYLRRDSTGEIIHIDHTPFKLGTEETYADYVVKGNLRISRRHATILQENGQYYLSDTGSSNSTFLNGMKVVEDKTLRDGDVIHLADEKLIFNIG